MRRRRIRRKGGWRSSWHRLQLDIKGKKTLQPTRVKYQPLHQAAAQSATRCRCSSATTSKAATTAKAINSNSDNSNSDNSNSDKRRPLYAVENYTTLRRRKWLRGEMQNLRRGEGGGREGRGLLSSATGGKGRDMKKNDGDDGD